MMHRKASKFLRSHVLGLVAIFIALTGTAVNAGAAEDTATTSAISKAKFSKLKQRVAAVENKLNSSATGDIQGTYPNLEIRPAAVSSPELATDSITRVKVADGAIDRVELVDDAVNDAKLAVSSVGASELKPVVIRSGASVAVNAGTASGALSADCLAGEQVFAPGGFWSDLTNTGTGLAISSTTAGFGGASTSLVAVANVSGTNRNFNPQGWCLAP